MGRIARNELHLIDLADGRWKLHGYILGKQVRRVSTDLVALTKLKEQKEHQLEQKRALGATKTLRLTHLTDTQLRDAEAAVDRAGGRSLLDCVLIAQRYAPVGEPVLCTTALADWIAALRKRKRFPRTVEKNEQRVKSFLKVQQPKTLFDITPQMIEDWVFAQGKEGYTPLTDASVLRAWLNFCVRQKWLQVSPLEIDMRDLAERSRAKEKPRILKPEQCWELLRVAQEHGLGEKRGRMAGFVILSTWLFMRKAEVERTTSAEVRLKAKTPVVAVDPRKRGTASHRTIPIPENILPIFATWAETWLAKEGARVPFSRSEWATIRARAGLIKLAPAKNGRRKILETVWQDNILRHTGISYFYQKTGDIKETTRQAGNSDDTAFRHYLNLPEEGECERFYAPQV